ncbi:hypothetical protein CKM354_001236400 [Cercospora kikuchii]|uniref:Carrier domain-containing protein n=1 Tax=Cercospora kikuchii TaxID=84275 RepID=A0A9P3L2K2_9PEZI|nr:uncharacterized protein CKM354_001236400 [Cercospora kikuchii]GIZ49332.1 hypothetical protein CKM354_001236400 [Cercospora kikuchii]
MHVHSMAGMRGQLTVGDQTKITLQFQVNPQNVVHCGLIHYDFHWLSSEQANHLAATFDHALGTIIEHPGSTAEQLDLISSKDTENILSWTGSLPPKTERCVHHLITRRSKDQPEYPAISAWDGNVTYTELDDMSSRLAKHLSCMGVQPKQKVPLMFEKSKWAIIAMLAVMKTGAAFFFLDPSYPKTRLRTIVQTTHANVIVSSAAQRQVAGSLVDQVVCVDGTQDSWSTTHNTSTWTFEGSCPTDPLYIVFTSGSTGTPKGVLIEHSAFATRANVAGPLLRLNERPRVLQFSSFVFSAAHTDILTALIWGACLCVPSELERKNNLSSFMSSYDISWAALTPTSLKVLKPSDVPSLRFLALQGEAIQPSCLKKWASHAQIVSLYGLSEGMGATILQPQLTSHMNPLNIGHPVAGRVWLTHINDHDKLVPVGAVGEIVLEGPALARGYIAASKNDNVRFLTSAAWFRAYGKLDQTHLYKTGDLGRYDAVDGTIVYVGRKDITQIKVHGQMVDLQEVEIRLKEVLRDMQPEPAQALVTVVLLAGEATPRILACIEIPKATCCDGTDLTCPPQLIPLSWRHLKERLATLLPAFMIPFTFIPITHIPQTLTGKRDNKGIQERLMKLSLVDLQAYNLVDGNYEAPIGRLEIELRSLWERALGQKDIAVGRQSNFFQLGGDSVAAMVLAGLARGHGMRLLVENILQNPVLCDQAKLISSSGALVDRSHGALDSIPAFSLVTDETHKAILDIMLQQHGLTADQIEDCYPCTAIGEAMAVETLKSAQAFVSQTIFRLHEDTCEEKYFAAWEMVMECNPSLRARIIQTSQGMFQAIIQSHDLSWTKSDELDKYLVEDKSVEMNISSPLVRFAFIKNGSEAPYCVLTMHHAIFDLWSLRLVVKQVADVYNGFDIPTTPFSPFIQYITQRRPESKAFWTSRLRGCEATTFPRIPPGIGKPSPRHLTETIDIADSNGHFLHVTLSNLARAAWAITISHFLGAEEICFGAVVNGRGADWAGVDRMTGPTLATVPVRMLLPRSAVIHDIVEKFQKDAIEAIPYEQLGLAEITQLGDGAHAACSFQSLLVVQARTEIEPSHLMQSIGDMRLEQLKAFGTYAMTLVCQTHEEGRSLDVQILFDDRIISGSYARGCLEHFAHVFASITSHPDTTIGSVPSITKQDLAKLQCWNGSIAKAEHRRIHDFVLKHCNLRPAAEAVYAWDGSYTYHDLWTRSCELAHVLIDRGVTASDIVPICMTRSKLVPVAMLAAGIAGASFTLLDISHPMARIHTLLKLIDAKLVVSKSSCSKMDALQEIVPVIDCSLDVSALRAMSPVSQDATACMYVAWTSGSSGTPKGAMVSHQSFIAAASSYLRPFRLDRGSRFLQLSSHAFDGSILEEFATLMAGGCICIPSEHDQQNLLTATINELRISHLLIPPTRARLLQPRDLPSLKTVILGGEAVNRKDIRTWKDSCHLVIAYGPAECSIVSTVQESPEEEDEMSIGNAVSGACWIVDPSDHNILMPIGAIGELVIEGLNVGLGYLHDSIKTRTSFVEYPKWLQQLRKGTKTRVYKTGDLVQYYSNDRMRYIGRKDEQRKLNGMRIELAEVEKSLYEEILDSTIVRNIVVEFIEPSVEDGRPIMAAFMELDPDATNSRLLNGNLPHLLRPSEDFQSLCSGVRSRLMGRLPRHLVPAVFLPLCSMPRTESQKVSRRKLKDICSLLSESEWSFYTRLTTREVYRPSTEKEILLHELVTKVLRIGDFEMSDIFTQLGGDSIAAMRLSALAREHSQLLTVAEILSNARLFKLAANMQDIHKEQDKLPHFGLLGISEHKNLLAQASQACSISQEDVEDVYPCTSFQEQIFEYSVAKPGSYVGFFEYQLSETADISRWKAAWRAVYDANPILRTRIFTSGGRTFQVVLRSDFHWTTIDAANVLETPRVSFGTPLSYLRVVKSPKDVTTLVFVVHHALYDGWALPVISHQVESAFLGHKLLVRQFSLFVKYVQDLDRSAAAEYWRANLEGFGAKHFPVLPCHDYIPDPAAEMDITIPVKSFSIAKASAVKLAWAIVIAHHSQSDDVVFLNCSWGRDAQVYDITKIVGPTLSEYPFRFSITPSSTIDDAMQLVDKQAQRVLPFQNVGLRSISRFSDDAAAACRSSNSLVIHPPAGTSVSNKWLEYKGPRKPEGQAIEALGIILECSLSELSIGAHLEYDERLIPHEQAKQILADLEHVLKSIEQCATRGLTLVVDLLTK